LIDFKRTAPNREAECYCVVGMQSVNIIRPIHILKKPKAPSLQNRSVWNLAGMFLEWIRIDWWSLISDMTLYFQDHGYDVIREKPLACRVCRHVPTYRQLVYVIRCWTGSQCSWRSSGLVWDRL